MPRSVTNLRRLGRFSAAMAWIAGALGCAASGMKVSEPAAQHRSEGGPTIEQMVAERRQATAQTATQEVSDSFPTTGVVHGPPRAEPVSQPAPITIKSPTIEQTNALGEALAELESQGAIDAATRSQLLDGLKQTDPALWPQLLAYFKTAAAKRQATQAVPAPIQLASAVEPEQVPAVAEDKPQTVPPVAPAKPEAKVLKAAAEAETCPATAKEKIATPATDKSEKPKRTKPKRTAATRTSKSSTGRQLEKGGSKTELSGADWKRQLEASIAKLEKETAQAPSSNEEIGKHAALRMLYLAAGRREDALKPIAGIPPAQQDFWSKEIFGLSAYMDCNRNPDASRRAAEANGHFREATVRLGELATLQVRNLAFCSEVTSYGVYKTFESTEFTAGQELLLYAEIENFKSKQTDRGYHTALKASYQILDERGARVDEKEFAITEEHCQNPRRDFFVRYFVWLPQQIYGGTYTLQLSVEDTLGQKIGQSSLEFKIKGRQSDEKPAAN